MLTLQFCPSTPLRPRNVQNANSSPSTHVFTNSTHHGPSRTRLLVISGKKSKTRSKFRRPMLEALTRQPLFVSVQPDGSDLWRLDPIIELIKKGGVGIIPTDTLPAVVCDMSNKDAVRRLYSVKHMNPKKPLSLLCRGFSDIGQYTTGFPVSNISGVPNMFSIARQILPGPVIRTCHHLQFHRLVCF